MNKTPIKKVIIKSTQGETREVLSTDLLKIHTEESVMKYAGIFKVLIDNTKGKNSKLAEAEDEVEIILGYEETGSSKVMGGFIDRVIMQKDEEGNETLELQGRSYSSVLLDTKISGKIDYTEGYSQVLREILKGTPLKPDGILDTKGKGTIIFRNTPLINIVRQLAMDIGWTFKVDHDKVFHFIPIGPPEHSGITLTEKDIKSFRIIKRRK